MIKTDEFMGNFMKKLGNNEYPKEVMPDSPDDKSFLDEDFIEKEIKSYSKLLNSKVVKEAIKQ